MRFFSQGRARAWRAAILASSLAWLGAAADLRADPLDLSGPESSGAAAEPFGLFTTPVNWGLLREKWLGVERELDDERVQLALCDGDRDRCASPAALRLLVIVDAARSRDGRARLGEVNRAVNLAIRPMSDLAQYGQIDVWSSPLATFAHGAGDCEDYAIAKITALQLAGVAADDLRIVIMHDAVSGEDHAVAAARLQGHWLMLDNRRMAMVEDFDVRNYRPTFVIDQSGVRQYVDTSLQAGIASDRAPRLARTSAVEPSLISP